MKIVWAGQVLVGIAATLCVAAPAHADPSGTDASFLDALQKADISKTWHHTGSFSTALDGVNTPELQTADNDYAVGLVAQKIASSPAYRDNTLIFVIEDDSQAGVDHVD